MRIGTAQSFPCDLRDVAPAGHFHVYAEYRGRRFYITSEYNWYEADARAWCRKRRYPLASVFLSDRADSTHIDGDEASLWREYHRGG